MKADVIMVAEFWINELRTMEKNHYVDLDHKDVAEIAEILDILLNS